MTKVKWQQWTETWHHVSAGGYGVYMDHSREFQSLEEASGFVAGLKLHPHVRGVEIRSD